MALLDNFRKAKETFAKSKAKIQVLDSEGKVDSSVEAMVFHYNPAEYKVSRGANYTETYSRDSAKTLVQLSDVSMGTLNFSAVFDTYMVVSPMKKDVSDAFKALENLFILSEEKPAPPKVLLQYGAMSFVGYITDLTIDYTMFTRKGVPVRANVEIEMKLLNPDDVLNKSVSDTVAKAKEEALKVVSDASNPRG
ncbi:MAG: hypothetical protein JXO44_10530 [Clostridia bacterium]|nr:hypothetical protein [Clostridia bacterium]